MQRIREVRESASISATELAQRMGMTPSGIGHYEKERRTPDVDVARKIVRALNDLGANCTFDDVFPDPDVDINPSRKSA